MALTIITNPVTSINTTTATCGGNSISTPTGTITAKGVCWNTSANPTIALFTKTNDISSYPGNSNFTSTLTSLAFSTTYYVRAYVTETISGTSTTYYGANVVFTTLGLTTTNATSITSTTATSGANSISGFSLGSISASGVCWGTSSSPTKGVGNFTLDNIIGSVFTSYITGLNAGTFYYVRSYITSGATTYYGTEITFTTSIVNPTVTTNSNITSITSTGATVSGNVSSSGGANVTARGIQHSLIPNMSSGTTDAPAGAGGIGTYNVTLSGLTSGLTYYVRAYATNSNGTSYGAIYNFTTLGGPIVETVIPYSITSSTAQTGCNILNIGGSGLTERGVVISTSPDPTLATGTVYTDSYPGNGSQYLVKLTGLTKDTTYYIRAYAINSQGTGYAEELIFSTTSCNPLIEDCNPQEFPTVACTDTACEYIISAECVVGNEITPPTSCNVITTQTDLINSLIQINNNLCNISSKDFAIFILGSIINNPSLKSVFCYLKNITCEG